MSPSNFLPDLPNYDPEPADGVRVGESPVPGLTLKRILRGHKGSIKRITWSPSTDKLLLASPSKDRSVRIWDCERGKIKTKLPHNAWVNCASWSPNGKLLATGLESGELRIWDTETWRQIDFLAEHQQRVEDLAWSRDNKMLASASGDNTVKIWLIKTGTLITNIEHDAWVNAVEWSPDGKCLATGGEDKLVSIWSHGTWELIKSIGGYSYNITDIAWSPDGQILAAASGRTISIWNLKSGTINHVLEGHTDKEEREILLDAAAVLFLNHNLCFREIFNQQTFLVFPSLINEKRPKDENITSIEGASYQVKGAVENVYASLVVLLGYTNTFIRTHQWQNQAQYELGEGEICGFQQTNNQNGEIELVLYYGEGTPESVRLIFRGLFERFLSRRELEISRYQPVICPEPDCGAQLARNVVMAQLSRGRDFSFCNECGAKLTLPNPESLTRLSQKEERELDIQQVVAQRRTNFETALVRVKSLLRDRREAEKPTCFISYAWGVPEHERWVLQLAKDLRNADIDVLLDKWNSPPGSDLVRYIDQILKSKFVIVAGTPSLLQKYDSNISDPVVAAELRLINLRLSKPSQYGCRVLPLLVDGEPRTAFTPLLQTLVSIDFRDSDFYFRKLFDMIWQIYGLPSENPLLEELQASMSPQSN